MEPMTWEASLPLFSADMIGQWTMACAATCALVVVLFGVILTGTGEVESLGTLLLFAGAGAGGLWVLGILIMAVVFQGRMQMRFTIDDDGLTAETVSTAARTANRIAIVGGLLTGKPGLAGAGLIARAGETKSVSWEGAFRVAADPRRLSLRISNGWRTLFFVQCLPGNFDSVTQAIGSHMEAHATAARLKPGSPLPLYLGLTFASILACLPLFLLVDAFDVDLFGPIFVLCFSLATLWLVGLFGALVIGGLGYIAWGVWADLSEVRASMFDPGRSFSGFEVMGGDEWSALVLAGLGATFLIVVSVLALTGTLPSMLVRDEAEAGE
jgi:hypothetical protein